MFKGGCGCGIITGVLLAVATGAGVWYFFYCRNNPDDADHQFQQVEKGWENVKDSGDKTLYFVKENFTGKKSVKEEAPGETPATAPLLPPHPEDKTQNSKQNF